MKDIDVLLIGTPNIDIISGRYEKLPRPGEEIRVENIEVCLGGGNAITAIGLARLKLKPLILCKIKKDFFGEFILKELQREGVEVIADNSSNNTGITIALDCHKDRRFITYDGSVLDTSLDDVSDSLLKRTKHIHLTNFRGKKDYDLYSSFIERAKSFDITISLDVGWDDLGLWDMCVLDLARKIDIFFANKTEIMHYLKEDDIEKCFQYLMKNKINGIIKLGEEGAVSIKDGNINKIYSFNICAADSTGAGDSFNAGFIYAYLNNMDLKRSLQIANTCGALSVEGYGGYSKFPSPNTLNENLKKHYS